MGRLTAFFFKLLPATMILFLLSACHSTARYEIKNDYTEHDLFHDALFESVAQIPEIEQVFELSAEQEHDFLKKYNSFSYRSLSGSERIYKYLKDRLQYFNFHAETLMATDALAVNSGNCLSLAILTRALAKEVNVGTNFELARTAPVFQRENNIQVSSQHIRTVVYVKEIRNTKQYLNRNNKIRIDYFPTAGSRTLRRVDKEEFHAMFYTNRAAEALIKDDNSIAYWNIKAALKQQADNAVAINMLGVLYRRIGNETAAEKVFKYGLSLQTDQLELLNNYHKLLVKADRMDEAALIAKELDNHKNEDPFRWVDLAEVEFQEGNYVGAIKFFQKAVELADYLHQPYAGLAKANFMLGRPHQAIKAIEQAMKNSYNQQSTSIYQAKYEYFKSHSNIN